MGKRSAKFACSLDARLLERVERARALTGESRSAMVARALLRLTMEEERAAAVRRYVEVYRDTPERPSEVAAARSIARRTLAALPWDEE